MPDIYQTIILHRTMSKKTFYSSITVGAWLFNKFKHAGLMFDELKYKHIIFLCQMHYLLKNKRLLFPSFFVCDKNCFYEPSLSEIMQTGFPLSFSYSLSEEDLSLLNIIWQKYSLLQTSELSSFIKKFCEFSEIKEGTIVNPANIIDTFAEYLQINKNSKSLSKSKIMLSQNGPVRVTEWKPRKIHNN